MLDGMRVIDVHVHLAPERLARAVRRALAEMYQWEIGWPLDPDAVADDLIAAGTDRMVSLPYAHLPGMAASLNEHAVTLSRRRPEVLAMATVHPDDPDPVALLRSALDAGAVGLKVHCPVQRTAPDDPRMNRVYAACADWGTPVLMHAGHGPDARTPHSGFGPFARLMRRHPALRVCVAHLGAPQAKDFISALDRHEHMYLDLSAVAGWGLERTGADLGRLRAAWPRLLYGSDYPNTPTSIVQGLENVRAAGFAGERLGAVLAGNAARFLRLTDGEDR